MSVSKPHSESDVEAWVETARDTLDKAWGFGVSHDDQTAARTSLNLVLAHIASLEEQLEALREVAEKVGYAYRSKLPLWGPVQELSVYLMHGSIPASGERVAAGMPSSTSETSGANQSPEDSSPAKKLQ